VFGTLLAIPPFLSSPFCQPIGWIESKGNWNVGKEAAKAQPAAAAAAAAPCGSHANNRNEAFNLWLCPLMSRLGHGVRPINPRQHRANMSFAQEGRKWKEWQKATRRDIALDCTAFACPPPRHIPQGIGGTIQ